MKICNKYKHNFSHTSLYNKNGEKITLKIMGDYFGLDTKCLKCSQKARILYSNKHSEIIDPATNQYI